MTQQRVCLAGVVYAEIKRNGRCLPVSYHPASHSHPAASAAATAAGHAVDDAACGDDSDVDPLPPKFDISLRLIAW